MIYKINSSAILIQNYLTLPGGLRPGGLGVTLMNWAFSAIPVMLCQAGFEHGAAGLVDVDQEQRGPLGSHRYALFPWSCVSIRGNMPRLLGMPLCAIQGVNRIQEHSLGKFASKRERELYRNRMLLTGLESSYTTRKTLGSSQKRLPRPCTYAHEVETFPCIFWVIPGTKLVVWKNVKRRSLFRLGRF